MPVSSLYNLRRWRPSGAPPDPTILRLSDGTFTRSTSGSYCSGATNIIRWQPSNTLRYEDRGDGYGSIALFEGSRTNSALYSENMAIGNWTNANATKFAETVITPQGDTRELSSLSGNTTNARLQQTLAAAQHISASVTVFMRTSGTISAPMNIRIGISRKDTTLDLSENLPITQNWKRLEHTTTVHTGSSNVLFYPSYHSSSTGGPSEWIPFMAQTEWNTGFPSSYISSSNTTATRGADLLSFASGTYPLAMIGSGSIQFDIYPYFASSEIGTNTDQVEYNIFGVDNGTNSLRFIYTAPNLYRLQLVSTSSRLLQDVEFSRHQKLTITLTANGTNTAWVSASLAGFTNGNGDYLLSSPTTLPQETLCIGSRSTGGTGPFFGRISNFRNPS